MQQLLTGRKRLPGFGLDERTGSRPTDERRKECHSERSAKREVEESSGYKMTELGLIPSDWEVKKLKEIGVFSKGAGIFRDESNSGNIPAVRYGEIYTKHNDYIKEFYSHISQDVAEKSVKMQRGDLLFSASGETKEDIGKTIAFVDDFDAYAGGDIIIFTPTETIDSIYMGYLLNFPSIAKQKAMKAQGDAVVHITTDSLKKLIICLPSYQEQTAIANVLSDMDTEISALETKLAKCRTLKTGMMQQLLTGKIRLV
jgi:type I restriction enzyme S subunit